MAFDLAGNKVREIMEGKNLSWLDPPNPYWRIEPPTLAEYIFKLGFRATDYDQRLIKIIGELITAYPGSQITYHKAPEGLAGNWQEIPAEQPNWKEAEQGTAKRALERRVRAWIIPADADAVQMAHWLAEGGWSMWKPGEPKAGVPRRLAQDAFTTAAEAGFVYLVSSWWDNQFTEIALNPALAEEAAAA